ncbi:class II aldolase/adducin family protein [Thermatribacter velox]|uniref:Class II aldolase/adducin family protein n=1 Tax=Thermatribacter velox TaxID=3039681 RepID=A0ABZ2YCS2_9BACT
MPRKNKMSYNGLSLKEGVFELQEDKLREDLVFYGNKLVDLGLVVASGGNISARFGNFMLISPSGLAFDELKPEDFVKVNLDNGEVVGGGKPSSEILMHWFCYRERKDVGAVVHTHPTYTIGVVSAGKTIPPMFPDFVAYVGKVAMIDYCTPCTQELAEAVLGALSSSSAVCMVNHGLLTVGSTLKEAFYRSVVVEEAARVYFIASIVGSPRILTERECRSIRELDAEKYRIGLLKNLS